MEKVRKFIASLSVAALVTSILGVSAVAQAATYSDVSEDHWAYAYVEELVDQGVLDVADELRCEDPANRAEFSKMVSIAFGFGSETDYDAGFTDMEAGAWYVGYINVLAQNGVLTGDTDEDGLTGTVRPGDYVNRAEAAKMLALAGGMELVEATGEVFSDVEADAWYAEYVETLYWDYVVDGYGDGTYGPGDWLTRCQLAKMVVGSQNPTDRPVEEEEEEEEASTTDTDADGIMDDVDNCVDDANAEQEDTDLDGVGDACPVDVEASEGSLTVEGGTAVSGGTVPQGATHVEMLNVDFTASDDDITLTELAFAREGVGATSDISNVYLYDGDDRLTTGRTISSDTQLVTFSSLNLDVAAGDTMTLTVVVDFSSTASAANTHSFVMESAEAVTHNGTSTEGTFPIEGEEYSLSGSDAGTVTISKYGSLSNSTVGETDAEVAKFKLEASTEDTWLQTISLRVSGTISNSLLSNFVLWEGTTEIASTTSVSDRDLIVFSLETPLEIERGDNKVFTITADIGAADANDMILIDLDENADIVSIGEVYGFGSQVVSTDYDKTSSTSTTSCSAYTDASCILVEGGQITISFNGPASDDIAVNARDISVFDFAITAQTDVEVRKLTFILAATTADVGTDDDDDLIEQGATANFTNIKMIDADTGSTLCSAQDVSTSGSDVTQTFNCTDTWYIDAAETRNVSITLNVANNTDLNGEEIKVTLSAVDTSEGIRDIDTGDYVTDIVPTGATAGNAQTVATPTLAVTLASSPSSDTVVKGSQGVEAVGFSFTAGDSTDVTVTSVKVSGYLDEVADGGFTLDEDNSIGIDEVVTAIALYDGDGNEISTQDETFSAGTATFSGLEWDILAGQTEKLVVVVTVDRSATPHNSTNDIFSIDIAAASTDVTALDEDGNTVTPSGTAANGGTSPTTDITVKDAGLIAVAASDDPVLDDKAIAGDDDSTDPLLVARFKVYSQDEDYTVTDLVFENDSAADNSNEDDDAVDEVILMYPTSLSAPDTLDGTASVSLVSGKATFTGLEMMVPASETDENSVEVEVYVTTNEIDSAGTVLSGAQIEMDFNEGEGFRAVGRGSGSEITHNSASTVFATTADVDGNQFALYKALPSFATHTASTVCPSSQVVPATESSVYCFSITASGTGQIQMGEMVFDATPNLLNTGSSSGQLANVGGWKLYKYDSAGTVETTAVGTGTWASTNLVSMTFTTTSADSKVSAGSTKYYVLKAPIAFESSTDTSSLSVRIAAETVTAHSASVALASVTGLNVWSDTSGWDGSASVTHTDATLDWTNSYKLETLPSDYLQLSES